MTLSNRDPISLLRYEAKRHPEIAELIANVGSMSDEEIRAAKVKLPWMRKALLELKSQQNNVDLAAFMESMIVDGINPDPVGETRQWIGGNMFVWMGKNEIEIRPGQLLWSNGQGVWLDTIYSNRIDPRIFANTKLCGSMSRMTYMDMLRNRLSKSEIVETTPSGQSQSALFKIYRI